jgi:formylglycine-generating enzyme required for sulfatase activity
MCGPDEECGHQGQCIDIGLIWKNIPGGTFQMGCSPGDGDCDNNENPAHTVTLSGFQMLETEVTEAQYLAVIGEATSCDQNGGGGPNSPVECINWHDAKDFCEAVGGRLSTEAEWEYAARGGTTTKYYCGDDVSCLNGIAWHKGNSDIHKHDVKGKAPNAYGLHDMLGNVWEWTQDCWHDSYVGAPSQGFPAWETNCSGDSRILRGGSYGLNSDMNSLRVSYRGTGTGNGTAADYGFRCVRPLGN